MIRLPVALAGLAVLALGFPAGTRATAPDSDVAAQALLQRAIASFANGAFAEARGLLARAETLTKRPSLLGQIQLHLGLNHAAENRINDARRHFAQALAHDPRVDLDERQYKPSVVALFRSVRSSWEGVLEVSSDRADVEVIVRGRRVGSPPLRVRIEPGEHAVLIRSREGQVLHRSSLKVVSGQTSRIALALVAAPASVAVRAAVTAASPNVPEPSARRNRVWTWVAAGGAVALAAAAIGTGLSARSDGEEACGLLAGQQTPCGSRNRLTDEAQRQHYQALYADATHKALAANVAWAMAATLAVGSACLYWLERPRTSMPPRRVRVGLGVGAVGVELVY
jgi:hypothetical protein